MTSQRKMVGAHINDANRDIWDQFVAMAASKGLSNSQAMEHAAVVWLRDQGVWVFDDPGPERMQLVRPINPGDFEPFEVPVEVAPYVDRWANPPRIVLPGDLDD